MFRSHSDEPPPSAELGLLQHGLLTLSRILELLRPGVLDATTIEGRRVRWFYSCTRANNAETKQASDELKQLHLQLGAAEVIVHKAPWLPDAV